MTVARDAHPPPPAGEPPAAGEPRPRRIAAKHLSLGLVPLLAGGFLASCGQENAYCTDRSGRVVDNRDCDDEYHSGYYGGHYWAFTGGRKYGKGQTVDPGAQQIAAADRAALGQKGGFGRGTNSASGAGRSFGGGHGFGG